MNKKDKNPIDYKHSYKSMLRFAKYLNLAGLELRSMQSYYRDLDLLTRYTGQDPRLVKVDQLRDYFVHVKCSLGWSPKTIRKAIAAMKHYYRGVVNRKMLLLDQIKAPDRKTLPEVLSRDEVVRIFGQVRFGRYRLPLLLCYGSGLRIGECVKLSINDIKGEANELFVRKSKGGKDHYTILSTALYDELKRYWKKHRNSHFIFPRVGRGPADVDDICRRMGKAAIPMGRQALRNALSYAVKAAGITRNVCPHTLRHSFATHLIEDGVPIAQVQMYLGHANIETTLAYVHLSEMSNKKALDSIGSVLKRLL